MSGFSLSFLAPGMLAGLLLVAGPVLAHLTGRREGPRVRFPTLRFLQAAAQRVRRRTRLENLVLLLLRCAALAALALLFARPLATWQGRAIAGVDPARDTVVLLDRSLSMRQRVSGRPVFEVARARAREVLGGLSGDARAALVVFDDTATVEPPGLGYDRGALLRALDEAEPGWGTTDLGAALLRARDLLSDAGVARGTVVVLTDGTATGAPPDLRGRWPEGVLVRYVDLVPGSPANRWIEGVDVQTGDRRGEAARVEARVSWVGGVAGREVSLVLEGDGLPEVRATAPLVSPPPVVRRFALAATPEGARAASVRLDPEDGTLPEDDRRCFFLEGPTALRVLLASGDPGSSPREDELYYVENAFLPRAGASSRITPEAVAVRDLATLKGGPGRVLVLANLADPTPYTSGLREFVASGGALLLAVGALVQPEAWWNALRDLLPARMAGVKDLGERTFEQSPLSLATPDLDSPVFRVFREGGSGVFARVRFGRVMAIEPELPEGARVVLRYSDGRPALLERAFGQGRVALFTSTLDDDWTDFPLRGVFVPTLHELVRDLAGQSNAPARRVVEVGEPVRLPAPPGPGRLWIVRPDGREVAAPGEAAAAGEETTWSGVDMPGAWSTKWQPLSGGDARTLGGFCANPPVLESGLDPVVAADLAARVPGLQFVEGDRAGSPSRGEATVEKRSSLAPAFLALLLLALVGEAGLAARRAS